MEKSIPFNRRFECAVIGGGPAGLAAALYLARFGRKTILFEAGVPRVTWAPKIHNLLGFPDGISGKTLLGRYNRHLRAYSSVHRVRAEAFVHRVKGAFEIHTAGGTRYFAQKVILACGVEDVSPQIPNLVDLRQRGLLRYCSICDGFEIQGKQVAVIARSRSDLPKAEFIRNWAKNLLLIVPPTLRLNSREEKKFSADGFRLVRTASFKLKPANRGRCLDVEIEDRESIRCALAYIELGCGVKKSAFRSIRHLRKSSEGYLEASAEQRTSVPGLFAIGDCVNRLGQVSVALGQAAIAATNVHNELPVPKAPMDMRN